MGYQQNSNDAGLRVESNRLGTYGYTKGTSGKVRSAANNASRTVTKRVYKSSEVKTLNDLKTLSKSDIINKQNTKEISSHFKEKYGINLVGFDNKNLDEVKILMSGFDDVFTTFSKGDKMIRKIQYDANLRDFGMMTYDGVISIGKKGLASYGTGLHEAVHSIDYEMSDFSKHSYADGIVKQARKNLGISKGNKEYDKLSFGFIGSKRECKKVYEVFAYAIETEIGRGQSSNKLSKEIMRLLGGGL